MISFIKSGVWSNMCLCYAQMEENDRVSVYF